MVDVRPIITRDEWLEWRREVLTASDIGAVAGVDHYKTPLRVYAEKVSFVDVAESPIMRRGRMFEMAAIGYLAEDHPDWEITRPNAFYSDAELRLGATPDAFAKAHGRTTNIQIKTVSAPVFAEWGNEPPTAYLLQTVCENMLTDADDGILAVLVVSAYGAELHEFPVPRHEGAEQRIRDIAAQFWENVGKGLVPRPDYRLDGEVIAQLHRPDNMLTPLVLDGDNRMMEVLTARQSFKADVKRLEEDIDALDAEIIHKLDGATLATCNGWKITNKVTNRGSYVVPAKSFPVLRAFYKEPLEAAS